jgi:hypothetical protein
VWTHYAKNVRNKIFLGYGAEFLHVAKKTGSPLVKAFLIGHALELLLKTYLLSTGLGERDMRVRGHNLTKLLTECDQKGLGQLVRLQPELFKDVTTFNSLYQNKLLEYFSIIYTVAPLRLPDTRRIQRFCDQLQKSLREHLGAV